ncbi:MAG: glycoside hydrolase, family 16 [Sphingomonas bacterium]|nr:glycoside hydrolase, family 16 [Sphingomonas bacterium]
MIACSSVARPVAIAAGSLLAMAVAMTALCAGATNPPAPGPPAGYDLVLSFADEFDGRGLDRARWTTAYADRPSTRATIEQRTLAGNRERQVYVDPAYLGLGIDPFEVRHGILTIRAKPMDAATRAAIVRELDQFPAARRAAPALREVAYTSGLISTRGSFTQRYGYFETRARWSAGKGLWPAFWMLPEGGGWPPEIDILEAHGDKPITYHSIHSNRAETATRQAQVDDPQQFHRYGALWLPDRVAFYIDGRPVASLPSTPDLTMPMYLLLNLAVGGYWPGDPTPDVKFPATMQIDYVRAWRFRAAAGRAEGSAAQLAERAGDRHPQQREHRRMAQGEPHR